MNNKQQKAFIGDMCDIIKAKLQKAVETTPDEWDGIELRWLMQDYVDERIAGRAKRDVKRRREYNNYMFVHVVY